MFPLALIAEIASLRLRQRRLIKLLNDKNLIQWDGAIQDGDPEYNELLKQITDKWSAEQEELSVQIAQSESTKDK